MTATDRPLGIWLSLAYQPIEQLVPLAQAAEEVGFTGVTIAEHLVTPSKVTSRYPYRDDGILDVAPGLVAPDPLVAAAVLARATTRLRIATTVYLLPLHELFSAAKAIATAACFSAGRLMVGVGVGWMREEFELTRQPFESRGQRTDEMLEAIRLLLSGGMVEYHGDHVDFGQVQVAPTPEETVPIIVGGESAAAINRAARMDGWIGARAYQLDELSALVGRLRDARARLEQDHGPPMVVTSIGIPAPDALHQLSAIGVTDVTVRPRAALGSTRLPLERRLDSLRAYGAEHLPP